MSAPLDADGSIVAEQQGWGRQDSVAFFTEHRQGPKALYLSEQLVLPPLAREAQSVLDIGCAAGGFVSVFEHFNPDIRYVGVDVIHTLLRRAQAAHPEAGFARNDGATLPFAASSHDLVWSTGILHLNSAFADIVRDAWRVAGRWLACDFRLSLDERRHVGAFDVDFGSGAPAATLPYILLPRAELIELFATLDPAPSSIVIRGYPNAVSPQARGVPSEALMAFVVATKPTPSAPPNSPTVTVDFRPADAFRTELR